MESKNKKYSPLILLFLVGSVAIVRFVLWTHLDPIFQGPDEIQHMAMVAQIDKHGLDIYKNKSATTWRDFEESYDYKSDFYGQSGIISKSHSLPIYAGSGMWGKEERRTLHKENFDSEQGSDAYRHLTYAYPPLYYATIALFAKAYRSSGSPKLVNYQYVMRLTNFPFFLCFLIYSYLLTQLVLPGRWGWLTFGMIACHPMIIFMSSIVNNDAGLLPLSAGLFYHTTKIITNERTVPGNPSHTGNLPKKTITFAHMIAAVFFSLCLSLTKNQGMLLSGMTLIFLSFYLLIKRDVSNFALSSGGICCILALYVFLPFWLGPTVYSGIPTPIDFITYVSDIFKTHLWYLIANLFGQFGWFEVNYPSWVYWSFGLFHLTVVGMVLAVLYRQWLDSTLSTQGRAIAMLIAIYISYWLLILAWQFLNMSKSGWIIQG
ncbi:MAG: DUF2142 domain-containing protein [Pseudobdellovibrionaceae bacterium]|nr:DUF2142 domain-containing protein [Pseudobdellovibrionaceae bacterium]